MNIKNYRQGDVLLFGVVLNPGWKKLCRLKKDNIIIEGEVTGHMHEVINGKLYESPTDKGKMVLEAQDGCKIIHPEHGTIDMPKGTYEIDIQREYTGKDARKVKD